MRKPLSLLVGLCLLTASLTPAASVAQPVVPHPQRSAVISLDFPGGPIEEYVAAVKDAAAPRPVNVVIRGQTSGFTLEPVRLQDVSVSLALKMPEGSVEQRDGSIVSVRVLERHADAGEPVYLLDMQRVVHGAERPGASPAEVLVLSLNEITTALPGDPPEVVVPAETVLTAVETAIGVAGGESAAPEIRFHPESSLLIVAGSKEAARATSEVVRNIFNDVTQRRTRAREIQKAQGLANPDSLEQQLADYRAEAQLAELRTRSAARELEAATRRLEELRSTADMGVTSAGEIRSAEEEVYQIEAAVQEERIMLERAQDRVHRTEQALERARTIAAGGASGGEADALRVENAMLRERLAVMEAQIRQLREQLAQRGGGSR